jgi:plastocyanin domain-containing protein
MTMKTRILSVLAIAGLAVACSKSENKSADKPAPADKAAPATGDRIAISVTDKGFEPENVTVPSGKPVTLVFTRKTDSTCAKEVVIPVEGQKIEKMLPLNEAVAVEITFPKAGAITYACGMDMIKGVVSVQ